jgi:hypothetical protein
VTCPNALPRGDSHTNTKLKDKDIPLVYKLAKARKIPQWKIAKRFKISQALVSNILHEKRIVYDKRNYE